MTNDFQVLENELGRWRGWFNNGSRAWSFAHHFSAYGAVLTSSLATYVAQQPGELLHGLERGTLTALLALITTILAAIAAAGGFERKWRSSRLSRSRIDLLQLDLRMSNPDLQAIHSNLKKIIEEHDNSILGLLGTESREAAPGAKAGESNNAPHQGRPDSR